TWFCWRFLLVKMVFLSRSSSWTVDVPSSVKGLLGSCVVIPCSYSYPHVKVIKFTGIWKTTKGDQVICHSIQSETLERYRSRTKLLGDIGKKSCSLMIENLQQSDGGPFYFRIELGGHNKYSFFNKKVSISTFIIVMIVLVNTGDPNPIDLSVQEEVKEGQTVSASCSVSHSCPTYPPAFHWSHFGEQRFQAQELADGQWKATSTLTFHPNHTDHNEPLQCRVTYHGGKHQETSQALKVKCKCSSTFGVSSLFPNKKVLIIHLHSHINNTLLMIKEDV
uniref:Ig-like domain-containing protein n=1 Tax=Amphilophus citrinellus TaxID=61819 RepID=A0A3Q0T3D2_AMPCI